jgi:hypothetical protein
MTGFAKKNTNWYALINFVCLLRTINHFFYSFLFCSTFIALHRVQGSRENSIQLYLEYICISGGTQLGTPALHN